MTIEIDVVDNEVNVNVTSETVELLFYDAAIFDPDAFASWLLNLPAYENAADALTDLGPNKLYWIASDDIDTEFPNTLKRTPLA